MQKCRICQSHLEQPTYRKWHEHFHFPAHGPDEWESCFKSLLYNNFKGLYKDLPTLITLGRSVPREYAEIVELVQQRNSLELLLKAAELKRLINTLFPPAELTPASDLNDWAIRRVSLDKETYRRLVAIELETNLESPTNLTHTTRNVITALETGRFPIEHPLYHGQYPLPRTSQTVRVPYALLESLNAPWIAPDHALERILTVYAELVPASVTHLDAAYSVLRGEIKPSTLKRKLGKQESAVLSIIALPDLPKNKRAALKMALSHADFAQAAQDALEMEDGKRTSTRVDREDLDKLKDLATRYQVPAYKLATALLSQVK